MIIKINKRKLIERETHHKVGLALSGGGIRGLAHIGILKGLMEAKIPIHMISCQRRIKFDRNAGWKLTHFAGGLKRRILLTPVRVSPVYPWWRYQPVAQSLSQLLTYPLICKFRREY